MVERVVDKGERIMRKKLLVLLGLTMLVGSITACGSKNENRTDNTAGTTASTEIAESTETAESTDVAESAEKAELKTYEFETFDGLTVVINEGNIISQEACKEPLEWESLPADAEQIAPGRDFILFADSTQYYVEDAANSLVTIAFKELGDVIEETDYAIFDNDIFSFHYDTDYFIVMEDEAYVTVSFYNEETQTAGSNTITFTVTENTDAKKVANELAEKYGVDVDSINESYFGADGVTAYTVSVLPTDKAESGNRTRSISYAVANGDDVIVIEVLTHVEPDEGMDMFINDKIAEVLDTFKID